MPKRALITGVTGQDGSYLAEFLLDRGYEVHGLIRRSSSFNTQRINHIYQDPHEPNPRLILHYGDLTDSARLYEILEHVQPEEVYNLAAQSHVRVSFTEPVYTVDVTALGAARLLEAIRTTGVPARFYQASSSEMYGRTTEFPQTETTPLRPCSPYACAKAYAFWQTINYRESYGMYCCNGILFNHESPRRGETFVTRKITRAATRIKEGLQDKVYLGSLDAKRDWGYSGDYVEAMWLMLQQDRADDYVVATGQMHSVQQFAEMVFSRVGLDWHKHVVVDPRYFRPTEISALQGDASKARRVLGWQPRVNFEQLVAMMVDADGQLARHERLLAERGMGNAAGRRI